MPEQWADSSSTCIAPFPVHCHNQLLKEMKLQNKIALVTGASRGIGRATALALAEAGAHVLVHYGRSVQEAESLVSAIQSKGGAQMPSRLTWLLETVHSCSPSRCVL